MWHFSWDPKGENKSAIPWEKQMQPCKDGKLRNLTIWIKPVPPELNVQEEEEYGEMKEICSTG